MPKRKAEAAASDQDPESSTKPAAGASPQDSTPYPDYKRPSPDECMAACQALADLHGLPDNPFRQKEMDSKDMKAVQSALSEVDTSQRSVLDSTVRTMLSQNTTDVNSKRAFAALKEAFPQWEDVRQAPDADVEATIKSGGLAATKTKRIKAILNSLVEERGECSLEHLRHLPDTEIKAELSKFKGVGKKTIACVLMFCLGSHEFPVDTHVWRITKRLGWVPPAASRDQTYDHLNERVPASIRYDLHVLLVEHGKCCQRCAKNGKPRKEVVGPCPLGDTQKLAAAMRAEGKDLAVPKRTAVLMSDGAKGTAEADAAATDSKESKAAEAEGGVDASSSEGGEAGVLKSEKGTGAGGSQHADAAGEGAEVKDEQGDAEHEEDAPAGESKGKAGAAGKGKAGKGSGQGGSRPRKRGKAA